MKVPFRAAAPLAAGFALLFAGPAMADGGGAVYTQTNSPTGNAVHRLDRGPDGSLTPVATYRTGGTRHGRRRCSRRARWRCPTTAACWSPSTPAPTTSRPSASAAAGT